MTTKQINEAKAKKIWIGGQINKPDFDESWSDTFIASGIAEEHEILEDSEIIRKLQNYADSMAETIEQ